MIWMKFFGEKFLMSFIICEIEKKISYLWILLMGKIVLYVWIIEFFYLFVNLIYFLELLRVVWGKNFCVWMKFNGNS